MIEARSMYFGGEIIIASECDYQSGRNLGLICPFCNSAVFIRSESTRMRGSKIQLVRPYFAHYPSGHEDNWDCENRSRSKQGKEEIERLKIQARDQRLRLYNAHLWSMIAEDRNITYQRLNKMRSLFGESWCEMMSVQVRHEWKQSLDGVYTFIDAALQEMEAMKATGNVFAPTVLSDADWKEQTEKQATYIQTCGRRLQRAICFEVADFLSTGTAGFAFVKIFKATLLLRLMVDADVSTAKRMSPRLHVPTIAAFIAGTHWVDQINKRLGEK